MKKVIALALSLLAIAGLPACMGRQNPKPVRIEKSEPKRVSGPLAEKEVGWEQEDYK